jgi:DNA topoisomerase-1
MSNVKTLVIVESPAKAHKIQEYLGKDYVVMASKGHIVDLAKGGRHGLGVDIEKDFRPHYVLMEDKVDTLNELMAAAKKVDQIFVASDPDREGEAIAWHLAQRLGDIGKPIKRMVFNKIKKDALLKAVKEVRDIDMNLFHAQEARRILDRLVGFTASPFLMNFFGKGLSAGRVQSVVTRMVIDREREIESFVPEEFWTLQVMLSKDGKTGFVTKYSGRPTNKAEAEEARAKLSKDDFVVAEVIAEEEKKYPSAPLVTSTLQQIMSKEHGFGADRTMKAAQSLYEGGYITYIRTDSVRVDDASITELRDWLKQNKYGVPVKAYTYKNRDAAQDAHECIHPTDINLLPNQNYSVIDPDEKLVYEVVWKYFVASQMMPAVYDTIKMVAYVKGDPKAEVKASGKALKIKGFLEILGIEDDSKINIPLLNVGDTLTRYGKSPIKMEKKQTQPPPRYSEDKLIKELVNKNIGRPATYAELLSKITSRNYVEKRGNTYHATDLGKKITDELLRYFTFMDYDYTAKLERQLDEIESGKIDHIAMLKKFYPEYKQQLNQAYTHHGAMLCDQCGSPMVLRTVKTDGSTFYACIAFPKCRNTKNTSKVV